MTLTNATATHARCGRRKPRIRRNRRPSNPRASDSGAAFAAALTTSSPPDSPPGGAPTTETAAASLPGASTATASGSCSAVPDGCGAGAAAESGSGVESDAGSGDGASGGEAMRGRCGAERGRRYGQTSGSTNAASRHPLPPRGCHDRYGDARPTTPQLGGCLATPPLREVAHREAAQAPCRRVWGARSASNVGSPPHTPTPLCGPPHQGGVSSTPSRPTNPHSPPHLHRHALHGNV